MSRIGRQPIAIPTGVDVHVGHGVVQVKGPKGSILINLQPKISASMDSGQLQLKCDSTARQSQAFFGLNRALIANAVTGVSTGWQKVLEIVGIGYRAEATGPAVVFHLGYSHSIEYGIPEGISIDVDAKANRITVSGIDRQRVGQVAAEIRALRPPEPYKGKGIRYSGEYVRIKAGKQGAKV